MHEHMARKLHRCESMARKLHRCECMARKLLRCECIARKLLRCECMHGQEVSQLKLKVFQGSGDCVVLQKRARKGVKIL